MEDLQEEPELEEREEKEEEEEEEKKEEAKEEGSKEEEESTKKPEVEDENKEEEEKNESNEQDDELLLRPVRNKTARRPSLTDELDPDDTRGLLETNFSVTGLNEIKTERIIPRTKNTVAKDTMPKRPMSLDLNAPIKFRKLRGAARPEKVTARLIDDNDVSHQSRGRGYVSLASTLRTQDK